MDPEFRLAPSWQQKRLTSTLFIFKIPVPFFLAGHPIQLTLSTVSICPSRNRRQEFPISVDVSRLLLVLPVYPFLTRLLTQYIMYIADSLASNISYLNFVQLFIYKLLRSVSHVF